MSFLGKNKRKLFWTLMSGVFLILMNYKYIANDRKAFIYEDYHQFSTVKYALFLGTPKYLPNGNTNHYYKNRIAAVTKLYKNNNIKKIIISADIMNKYQENEVELITDDLILNGINTHDLILDTNGNSTWHSIIGAEKIIQQDTIVVISQSFHLERALYIAHRKNMNAIGYTATGKMSNKLWIREVLTRVKMQMDLLID